MQAELATPLEATRRALDRLLQLDVEQTAPLM